MIVLKQTPLKVQRRIAATKSTKRVQAMLRRLDREKQA